MFGGKLIGHNDPDYQDKVVKFNELLANCVMYSTACDITDAANDVAAEGELVDPADLATISPYITHTVRRFGNWTLNLTPPDRAPITGSNWNRGYCLPRSCPRAESAGGVKAAHEGAAIGVPAQESPPAGWPGGISPPGSHGTERESLPSLRSSHL